MNEKLWEQYGMNTKHPYVTGINMGVGWLWCFRMREGFRYDHDTRANPSNIPAVERPAQLAALMALIDGVDHLQEKYRGEPVCFDSHGVPLLERTGEVK